MSPWRDDFSKPRVKVDFWEFSWYFLDCIAWFNSYSIACRISNSWRFTVIHIIVNWKNNCFDSSKNIITYVSMKNIFICCICTSNADRTRNPVITTLILLGIGYYFASPIRVTLMCNAVWPHACHILLTCRGLNHFDPQRVTRLYDELLMPDAIMES